MSLEAYKAKLRQLTEAARRRMHAPRYERPPEPEHHSWTIFQPTLQRRDPRK